jgi:hypothetical protein
MYRCFLGKDHKLHHLVSTDQQNKLRKELKQKEGRYHMDKFDMQTHQFHLRMILEDKEDMLNHHLVSKFQFHTLYTHKVK